MANLGSTAQDSAGGQILYSLLEAVPVFSQIYRAAGPDLLAFITHN